MTFNINEVSKKLFLVSYVIRCYHSNEFVEDFSRFSEVMYHMLHDNEILKVFKSKI